MQNQMHEKARMFELILLPHSQIYVHFLDVPDQLNILMFVLAFGDELNVPLSLKTIIYMVVMDIYIGKVTGTFFHPSSL